VQTWGIVVHLLPCGNLFVVPDARNARIPASLRCDACPLRNEECSWDASSLFIIVDREFIVDVICLGTEASERCKHDPVLESEVSDLQRGEKLG
jgi:hypothetical protein